MPSYNIHQCFLYFFILNICGAFYGYTQQSTTEWQFNQMPQNPKLTAGYITSFICYNLLLNCYEDICQNYFKSYFPLLKIAMRFGLFNIHSLSSWLVISIHIKNLLEQCITNVKKWKFLVWLLYCIYGSDSPLDRK